MDQIERITSTIQSEVGDVRFRIERSLDARGPVWIDVILGDQAVCIDWRQGMSLGLSSLPGEGYGSATDEVYESIEELARRVKHLFETRTRTASPHEALLSELRSRRRISQEDLAQLLNVSQPNISKLERRDDMSIRRLRTIIEAIGGRLEVMARFGDELIRVSQFDDAVDPAGNSPRRPV